MRRIVILLVCLSLAAVARAAPSTEVHNLAFAFDDFWRHSHAKPPARQLADFRRTVASRFPAFYGIERYAGDVTQAELDARVLRAIERYPSIRTVYLRKAAAFDRQLGRYLAEMCTSFPDFQLADPVYVLHALGEMDGGPRTLAGRDYLIFGVDAMARLHAWDDDGPFFEHELFHRYHDVVMASCDSGQVWSSLWKEGLATWVSHAMNPDAGEPELLLDFPQGTPAATRAQLKASFAHLEGVIDSSDTATWAGLFQMRGGDAAGLPQRRGYYLGYLVAREAARTHDLHTLARLDCDAARALVRSTVHALAVQPRESTPNPNGVLP